MIRTTLIALAAASGFALASPAVATADPHPAYAAKGVIYEVYCHRKGDPHPHLAGRYTNRGEAQHAAQTLNRQLRPTNGHAFVKTVRVHAK